MKALEIYRTHFINATYHAVRRYELKAVAAEGLDREFNERMAKEIARRANEVIADWDKP